MWWRHWECITIPYVAITLYINYGKQYGRYFISVTKSTGMKIPLSQLTFHKKKQLLSLILYRDMIVYTTIYVQSLLWRYCDFLVDSCDRCTHLFQGHSTLISLSAAYIHRWTGLAWVRVMTCRLFGAKPLPEPSLFACLAQTLINSFAAWNGWKSPLHDMSTTISPRL